MQISVEKYLAQPNIFCDDKKELRNLLSEFNVQFLRLVHRDYSLHVLFLHQIHDLAAVGNHFQRLASHQNFFLLKDFPVLEPRHYPRKYLVEVLVDGRVLVAELLRLVQQILAQQIALYFGHVFVQSFVVSRFIVVRHFVLFLHLLNYPAFTISPSLALQFRATTHGVSSLLAIVV